MSLILLLHVTVAFSSMVSAALAFIAPSKPKLTASYALAATTLASGVYLVFQSPGYLVQACAVGLAYFSLVGGAIALARRRFTVEKA